MTVTGDGAALESARLKFRKFQASLFVYLVFLFWSFRTVMNLSSHDAEHLHHDGGAEVGEEHGQHEDAEAAADEHAQHSVNLRQELGPHKLRLFNRQIVRQKRRKIDLLA